MDLSKAFDRAPWPALWLALFEQGVPQHLICFFYNRCTADNMVQLSAMSVRVTNSRSQAVCDRAALSVRRYFVLFCTLPFETGGMPLDRAASI